MQYRLSRRRLPRLCRVIAPAQGREYALTVKGNAMAPLFIDGDLVTVRHEPYSPAHAFAPAVCVNHNGRVIIGRLVPDQGGAFIATGAGPLLAFDRRRDFIGPVIAYWRKLEPAPSGESVPA